ncbi:MAG: RNA polymerase sigma factor [Ilumatobacter sp.]|nr:RNA polymerase sigma factor [Ilumatobacter sp.]
METLWRIYQPQILRLLRAKRTPDSDDVASRVWIDVGRSLDRFSGDGTDFRRWIFRITSRRSVDAFRSASRHAADRLDRLDDVLAEPDAAAAFDAHDSLERALTIVGRLPPATAEAVMLRVVFDLSVADVARIMDRDDGTVRVLVHRGLRRLRELLGGDERAESSTSGEENSAPDVTPGTVRSLM